MRSGNLRVARPSFLTGIARTWDLCGVFRRRRFVPVESPQEADVRAIASDWRAVGSHLRSAMNQYEAEHRENGGE